MRQHSAKCPPTGSLVAPCQPRVNPMSSRRAYWLHTTQHQLPRLLSSCPSDYTQVCVAHEVAYRSVKHNTASGQAIKQALRVERTYRTDLCSRHLSIAARRTRNTSNKSHRGLPVRRGFCRARKARVLEAKLGLQAHAVFAAKKHLLGSR